MIIYNYIYKRCLQFKCNAKHGEDEMDCINVKSCYLSYHLDPWDMEEWDTVEWDTEEVDLVVWDMVESEV
jgi:hypothetical protein